MIHLNKGENQPHEWITWEEFEKRYPNLAKEIKRPVDKNEHGQKLKALRQKKQMTISELAYWTGFGCAEICDIEQGRKQITPEINDTYCLGLNGLKPLV